ncbi:MAG: hypothetical protein AAGI17_08375 [Planctomycetota bacterium]
MRAWIEPLRAVARRWRTIEWTARTAAVIVALGVMSLSLVLLRHARLQAAHELTQSRRRSIEHQRELQRVRSRLAEIEIKPPAAPPKPIPQADTLLWSAE